MFKRIFQIVKSSINPSNTIPSLNVSDFLNHYKSSKNAILIDARTPKEMASGKIGGAINIDFLASSFQSKIENLDKDKDYFVYCHSGRRSISACKAMQQIDIKSTYNLAGGYMAYNNSNK